MERLISGSIIKQLIYLSLPLIIGNIFQQFYNTVDAIIISRYVNEYAFAAIGVASTVMNLFMFILVGVCTGVTVILAQFFGQNNLMGFRQELFTALILGLGFTLVMTIWGLYSLKDLLYLIDTPQDIFYYTYDYLKIIISGLITTFLYNYYSAVLRSVGDTITALIFLIVAIIFNVILDLIFIANWQMGIVGAAWATVISQLLSAILCYVYLYKKYPKLRIARENMHFSVKLIKITYQISLVTALHQSSVYIGKLFVQGAVNLLETPIIAGYTAVSRIEGFANSFGDSSSNALSIFIAQNVGNKSFERVRKAFYVFMILLALFGISCSILMYFTTEYTVALMLNNNQGIAFSQGCMYLETISLFYVFCFTGNVFVGYFDGLGKVKIPVIGAICHICLRVILSFTFIQIYGLNTVAIATGIGWILVNILWWRFYLKQKNLNER